jgi:hypothetical protein
LELAALAYLIGFSGDHLKAPELRTRRFGLLAGLLVVVWFAVDQVAVSLGVNRIVVVSVKWWKSSGHHHPAS